MLEFVLKFSYLRALDETRRGELEQDTHSNLPDIRDCPVVLLEEMKGPVVNIFNFGPSSFWKETTLVKGTNHQYA